jgi:translation initiation factor IF-2
MAKPRVHEVAKELGLSSKEVLAHLESIGEAAKSHSSTIDEEVAERVKGELRNGSPAPEATIVPPPEPALEAPPPTREGPADPPASVAEAPASPEPESPAADTAVVKVHHGITAKDLAERIDVPAQEIVKVLLGVGEMVTVTQSMSDDAVLLVAEELGKNIKVVDLDEEEAAFEDAEDDLDGEDAEVITRPPVVTVMGHVDHGKTSILDAIRQTSVVSGEAGGITQHIGAYQVALADRRITFIDTPGHAAFTAMRARGAQVTDIAVLVVAADDGVKPQTVEAIDHAKAAEVPIVVAVNKIDKPEADGQRVRQQLSDYGLLPEEWGGDTTYVDVSAKERTNLDTLLEMIALTADLNLDLKTNASSLARGVVIEAHLDKGRGPVATVLVKRGSLYPGDAILAGTAWGRVRAMLDDLGAQIDEAGPGQPVQILGWQSLPDAGDEFRAVEDERGARDVAQERGQHRREAELVAQRQVSLQSLLSAAREGEVPELNLLLKTDTHGSVEALEGQLEKLEQDLVRVNVLRRGVGAITENDITLAQASNAIVIGLGVVPTAQARALAEEEGVDVRSYRVIYKAVEEIEAAARGVLGPESREVSLGQAEVRATFRVPRSGVVAGCYVTDGIIRRNARIRLVRDGTIVYESGISSLKRFKDDVREVAAGYECGIGIEGFQDIKEGDVIQAFEIQEVAR